jgi:hypothetical protein
MSVVQRRIARIFSDSSDEDEPEAVEEAVEAAPTLPPGVRLKNAKTGLYAIAFRRGGKQYNKYGKDVGALVAWRVAKEAELDAQGAPLAKKHTAQERQSRHPNVNWHKQGKKWHGQARNLLTGKQESTKMYNDDDACFEALKILQARLTNEFEAEVAKRKAANPLLDGLPRAPAKAEDAVEKTLYWHVSGKTKTKYAPYRAVKMGGQYYIACEQCNQQAFSNAKGGEPLFCVAHGGGRRCPGVVGGDGQCPLGFAVQHGERNVYDGRCVRCFCSSFPNDERTKRARGWVHAKEQAVRKVLEAAFPDYNWTFDKQFTHRTFVVGVVNTRFRPDARVAKGDRVIIVEIDEHSHRGYLCAKEREREQSFVLQNRSKTVVMVRFNPDAYTDYSGARRPSCFTSATKDNEIVHVHPKQKKQWQERCKELVDAVRALADPKFELPPKQEDRPLLICELFYDNVNATPEDKRVEKALRANKALGKRKRALREAGEAEQAQKTPRQR